MMDKQINEPLQLNEVEAALLSEASVADCVVLARENSNATKKDVLAYIVGWKRLEPSQLKAHLRDRLPPHLLPSTYIPVSSIPFTPDGQVDKPALTDLEVIDLDLIHRWEENLRTLPEIEQVGVVTVEHSENLPPLHLSDLLRGWNRDSKHTDFRDSKPSNCRNRQHSESRKVGPSESQLPDLQPAISHGPPLQEVLDAPNTLSEVLQRAAANTPNNGILYIQPDGSEIFQSYSALLGDAERILMGLRRQALKPQDKVIFQLELNQDFISAFWGCVLGGFVPVPIAIAPSYEPSNGVVSKLHNAWQMLDRPMVLTSEKLAPSIRSLSDLLNLENFSVETVEDLRKESAGEVLQASSQDCHDSRSEDLALLMLTSGSTGMPKGVMLTHHNIIARSAGTAQMHSFSSEDISLNWFPLDHVVGLVMFHIRDVYLGCQQIHAPSELVLQHPLKWLDWMSRYSVTVTWAPNFAYGLINERAEEISTGKWDLSSIRYILNGGETVGAQTARRFMDLLCPHGLSSTAMRPGWGMSETSSGVAFSDSFAAKTPSEDTPTVDLGTPIHGISLRIVDDQNGVVGENQIGRLQIKGPSVTKGYYQNPELNREAFTADGWFNTGDLGFLYKGRLALTSRETDIIIINGINYHCHEIEAVVEEIEGVERSYTAACSVRLPGNETDKLAVFFNSSLSDEKHLLGHLNEIRAKLVKNIGVNPDYLVPVSKERIPKTAIGKIQRSALKKSFEGGEFDSILKRIDILSRNANTLPDWFYQRVWRRREAATLDPHPKTGHSLVFMDGLGLGESLCAQLGGDKRCVRIEAGSDFAKLNSNHYQLHPKKASHYHLLLTLLSADNIQINQVLHLWTYDVSEVEISNLEELDCAQDRGVYSLLFLAQALAKVHESSDSPIRLLVIGNHTQSISSADEIAYSKSPVLGLIRTIAQEILWLKCRHVDLPIGSVEANTARIQREIRVMNPDLEVAYRNGDRLVPRLEKVDLLTKQKQGPPFKQGGMYLISGGLGGISVEISKYLLQHYDARLLLVGRTSLPERKTWNIHLAQKNDISERIKSYQALEQLGGEIVYESVDICNLARLQQVVDQTKARWGCELDGIIHLAGVFKAQSLLDETQESLAETLLPKVMGTWALHQLLKEQPGAIFISFSSTAAIGTYASGNSFMEAFSQYQRNSCSMQSYCFVWSQWYEIGMSRGYQMRDLLWAQGYYAISRDGGLYSLLAGLQGYVGGTPLLIGLDGSNLNICRDREMESPRAQKLRAYFTTQVEPFLIHSSGEALKITDRFGKQSYCDFEMIPEMPLTDTGTIDREKLMTFVQPADLNSAKQIAPQNEIERQLAKIWQEVLDVPQVGIHNSFFELGGGSLLLAQVHHKLQEFFGQEVSMVAMFKYPTVHTLAKYLTDRQSQQPASTQIHDRAGMRSKRRTLMQQKRQIRQKYRSKNRH